MRERSSVRPQETRNISLPHTAWMNPPKNRGGYHSDKLQALEEEMKSAFDTEKRAELATQMTQTILDDNAFIFASHLENVNRIRRRCHRPGSASL